MESTPNLCFESGDTLCVTGAGSGIGQAVALQALSCGVQVSAWDLNHQGLEETRRLAGDGAARMLTQTVDVTSAEQVAAAFAATTRQLGPTRYLANNAGPASASDIAFEDAIVAAIGSVRLVTEAWLDCHPTEPGAAMVATASVAGNVIGTSADWYSASKAGIAGYVRHLAAFRGSEFRSNAVGPGLTDTPRIADYARSELGQRTLARIPSHRMGRPGEIAWVILFLLSPLAGYVNGTFVPVDGGWTVAG